MQVKSDFFLDARAKAKDLCYQFNQRCLKEDEKFMKQLLEKQRTSSVLQHHFGVIMAATLKLGKIFMLREILLFMTGRK